MYNTGIALGICLFQVLPALITSPPPSHWLCLCRAIAYAGEGVKAVATGMMRDLGSETLKYRLLSDVFKYLSGNLSAQCVCHMLQGKSADRSFDFMRSRLVERLLVTSCGCTVRARLPKKGKGL